MKVYVAELVLASTSAVLFLDLAAIRKGLSLLVLAVSGLTVCITRGGGDQGRDTIWGEV